MGKKVEKKTSILIIYTGGTIGMVQHPQTGSLVPVKFEKIQEVVPELKRFDFIIKTITFNPALDSSNMNPILWIKIARTIELDDLEVRVFNNGELRRTLSDENTSSPDFFSPTNEAGLAFRDQCALINLQKTYSLAENFFIRLFDWFVFELNKLSIPFSIFSQKLQGNLRFEKTKHK